MITDQEYEQACALLRRHDELGDRSPCEAWELDLAWQTVAIYQGWELTLAAMMG